MVVAGGEEFFRFGAGAKEQNLLGLLDLADPEQGHAVEVGGDPGDFGRRYGEEQLVVLATMQSELQRAREPGPRITCAILTKRKHDRSI